MIGWAFDSKGNMAPVRRPRARSGEDTGRPDQRQGRRHGPAAADRHLRHEQQQRREGEVVRGEPARQGREHHLHDLRRRLRDAGRPGVAEGGQADDRPVHRHRPDGAEAVRLGRQAGVQLRQRRPGRGLGDGGVRLPEGLADGEPGDEHAPRLLQERRPGVREALHAARRQDRRPGELRDRGEQRQRGGQPPERPQGRRDRHLDGVRRAAGARQGYPLAREQDADPELVGRRRHVLGGRRTRR